MRGAARRGEQALNCHPEQRQRCLEKKSSGGDSAWRAAPSSVLLCPVLQGQANRKCSRRTHFSSGPLGVVLMGKSPLESSSFPLHVCCSRALLKRVGFFFIKQVILPEQNRPTHCQVDGLNVMTSSDRGIYYSPSMPDSEGTSRPTLSPSRERNWMLDMSLW